MKPRVRLARVALLTLFLAALAEDALAQPMLKDGPPPEHRLVYTSLTALRLNPIGLAESARLTFRQRLYLSDALALRDNYVGGGLSTTLSPAYAKLGAVVETAPLTMLRLWAQFEVAAYFGTFSMIQSFAKPTAEFSDTTLRALAELPDDDVKRNYATVGSHATLGADAQAKLGPVAVRNFTKLQTARLTLRAGDAFYYDLNDDVLAQNGGLVLLNDTDLLWVSDFGLTAGARMSFSQPFYDPSELNENGASRVGPLVAYTFFSEDGAAFNNPTVLVVANWWLSHRYRTGADSSQLFPYVVVAFAFTGDLLPLRR